MSCNSCGCNTNPCCCGAPYQISGPKGSQGVPGIQGNPGFIGPTGPAGPSDFLQIKVTLSPAEIQIANSVPVVAIPSPGVGKAIDCISAIARYTFVSAAYTSTLLDVVTDTASTVQLNSGTFLSDVTSQFLKYNEANAIGDTAIIEDKAITLKTNADSVVGDSTVEVYISYRIVNL